MIIPEIINKSVLAKKLFPNSSRPRQLLHVKEKNLNGNKLTEGDFEKIKKIFAEIFGTYI